MVSGVYKTFIRDTGSLVTRRFAVDKKYVLISLSLTLLIFSVTVNMFQSGLPHFAEGKVIKGFGRGSKELGIPTANLPPETIELLPPEIDTGIYFGWANVDEGVVYKMVMSIGWNPYYKNKMKSMEVYLIHEFEEDFYGSTLRVCMLGYIRPELDFNSLDELLSTMKNDIRVAESELDKSEYLKYKNHNFFKYSGADENGRATTR